jgi:hypothetical protein
MLRLTCNNFEKNLVDSLRSFRQNDEFTDVTITCDVKGDAAGVTGFKKFPKFRAHRAVLVRSTSDSVSSSQKDSSYDAFFLNNPFL